MRLLCFSKDSSYHNSNKKKFITKNLITVDDEKLYKLRALEQQKARKKEIAEIESLILELKGAKQIKKTHAIFTLGDTLKELYNSIEFSYLIYWFSKTDWDIKKAITISKMNKQTFDNWVEKFTGNGLDPYKCRENPEKYISPNINYKKPYKETKKDLSEKYIAIIFRFTGGLINYEFLEILGLSNTNFNLYYRKQTENVAVTKEDRRFYAERINNKHRANASKLEDAVKTAKERVELPVNETENIIQELKEERDRYFEESEDKSKLINKQELEIREKTNELIDIQGAYEKLQIKYNSLITGGKPKTRMEELILQ